MEPLIHGVPMNEHHFHTNSPVSSSIRTFPLLRECRETIKANGEDLLSSTRWHSQVLCVAADIMGHGETAIQANQDAVMILFSSANPEKKEVPSPLDLSLTHAHGRVGRVLLQFSPEGQGQELVTPALVTPAATMTEEQRVWVSLEAVPSEEICDAVMAIAQQQGSTPGDLLSIIGAGALLTLFQTMVTMNAASTEVRVTSYGSDPHRFDALLSAQLGEKMLLSPPASSLTPPGR